KTLLAMYCNNKLTGLKDDDIFDAMAESDHKINQLTWGVIYDSLNESASQLGKNIGITIKDLREHITKIKELRNLVNAENNQINKRKLTEQLEQVIKEFEELMSTQVHTDQDDTEGVPLKVEVSNEMVEYFIKPPDLYVIRNERKEIILDELPKWADKQPKQATRARDVVEYCVKMLNDPSADHETVFKVTKVAEALDMDDKEVRRIWNKIKKEIPSLKDF
ncbi:MAG TPA: hypothetical protein VHT73_19495, partial [Thermodesulfobacteriota bacterium]|nr:hypothetical protein [Thermodesulfobacteriota bacterium]